MADPADLTARIAEMLRQHEYRFGHDTNCSCGAAGIWFWEDYAPHVAAAVVAELGLTEEHGVAFQGGVPFTR
jgi:hypothetical protein